MIDQSSCDKCGAVRTRHIRCDAEGCDKETTSENFVMAQLTVDLGDGESITAEFCKEHYDALRRFLPHRAKHHFSSI